MIKAVQCVHNLLGSKEDITALAQKTSARILVASDSHGSRDTLLAVLRAEGADCDAFVFCGDGVKDALYCIKCALNGGLPFPPVAALVRGNNDYDTYGNITDGGKDIAIPNRQVLQAAGHTILITHGHKEGVRAHYSAVFDGEARMAGADIVLFGHTHIAEDDGGYASFYGGESGAARAVNPGSLRFSRGSGGPSFAVIEVQSGGGMDVSFYCVTASLGGIEMEGMRV